MMSKTLPLPDIVKNHRPHEEVTLPHEAVKHSAIGGVSLVRAWREYLGLSQAEVAHRMRISLHSYAKMESKETRNRVITLKKIASALRIQWDQIEN